MSNCSSSASQCNKHQGIAKHQTSKETKNKTETSKNKLVKHTNQVHHHQVHKNVKENCRKDNVTSCKF
jgi:hypothetical protein